MRPPLSSRSSTKPRGSKIRPCPHSDLGEFLFSWPNCHWGEKIEKILTRFLEFPSVKSLKIWQRSYSLLAFLAFKFSKKFVRQGFRSAKKHKNAKNEKTTLTTPTLFDFKSFLLPDYTRWAYQKILPKEIEENWNQSQTDVKKWLCLSSFNLRLKALISEATVEQQILALVCYVS